MVHIVLVTKYRKPILVDQFRIDIKQFIFDTCVKYHWYVRKMETDLDHIHILEASVECVGRKIRYGQHLPERGASPS